MYSSTTTVLYKLVTVFSTYDMRNVLCTRMSLKTYGLSGLRYILMYVGMSVLSEFSRTYEGQVMEQSQANNDKNQSIYFVNLQACEDFRPSAKDHKFN